MNEDLTPDELMDKIRQYVEQTWHITNEVGEGGTLFQRAILKGHPFEVIALDEVRVYQFNLN